MESGEAAKPAAPDGNCHRSDGGGDSSEEATTKYIEASIPQDMAPSCAPDEAIGAYVLTSSPRSLFSHSNVSEVISRTNNRQLRLLQQTIFADNRWKQGLEHLIANEHWRTGCNLHNLLCEGAKVFGFWHLSEDELDVLTRHLLEDPAPRPSPAMQVFTAGTLVVDPAIASRLGDRRTDSKDAVQAPECAKQQKPKTLISNLNKHRPKLVLAAVVTILSCLYAIGFCFVMYPTAIETFSVMIFFARAAGFATLLFTAMLFATMSRSAMQMVVRILPWPSVQKVIDDHKDMHIFSAKMMFVSAFFHVLSIATGTVPAMVSMPLSELNAVFGCANEDSTKGYLGVSFGILQQPACPLTEPPKNFWYVVIQSTPGVTGLLLIFLATVVYYTADAARRKENFELFQYTHNAIAPMWLILLFIHGTNGWVGVGFPLVAFVCVGPASTYFFDRVLRLLRYYLFTGVHVNIVDVVIRPGPENGPRGALVNLMISKPPYMWWYRDGMYAFLNMPDYAPGQWHPFTICSGEHGATVDFIISGVGDWTCALASKSLGALEGRGVLPRIAMDGPYLAPTATAKYRRVLVAVGAGVGITPFLSLMSTFSAALSDKRKRKRLPLQEAHFYWMARSADEFLFGRKHFAKIMSNRYLRDRVFLHLHVTQKEPDKNAAAFLFREVIRRQSRIDRDSFDTAAKAGDVMLVPQLPGCWANHGREDVIWVKALLNWSDKTDAERLNQADIPKHWTSASPRRAGPSSADARCPRGWLQKVMGRSVTSSSAEAGWRPSFDGFEFDFDISKHPELAYMPVAFGRPDFAREICSIGSRRPDVDVHVYVCGNDALVESLHTVCDACTEQAKGRGGKPQKFEVHSERFG